MLDAFEEVQFRLRHIQRWAGMCCVWFVVKYLMLTRNTAKRQQREDRDVKDYCLVLNTHMSSPSCNIENRTREKDISMKKENNRHAFSISIGISSAMGNNSDHRIHQFVPDCGKVSCHGIHRGTVESVNKIRSRPMPPAFICMHMKTMMEKAYKRT